MIRINNPEVPKQTNPQILMCDAIYVFNAKVDKCFQRFLPITIERLPAYLFIVLQDSFCPLLFQIYEQYILYISLAVKLNPFTFNDDTQKKFWFKIM